jgi:hypothetical protein
MSTATPPSTPMPDQPAATPVEDATQTPTAVAAAEADMDRAILTPSPADLRPAAKLSFTDRLEAFIARLSNRNRFWNRVCSLIWLPYAFKSGIRMKRVDDSTFAAELPFRRFNRNWYNAMAGAALLGNSEIAGGMYVFALTGGDYTIVCKELSYKFLRPCFGPALYKITPREDLKALIAKASEFNITLDLDVIQQPLLPEAVKRKSKKDSLLAKMASKERRVGKVVATFHVTPSLHQKAKRGDTRRVG